MANLQLKKIILEVVDNQINTNNPPCTKEVYESLKEAGYSKPEAKEKIGAIVLTEIYDILKAGKDFDEEKYKSSLEEMLQQSIDYENDYHVRTEWDNGETQKAYEVVRRVTWGISCNADNSFLFMRAKQLAKQSGKHEECKWYQEQLDKFKVSIHNWEMEEDAIFDEFTMPKQIPVTKPEKIYPNDPCSCGSGKKYKKCCGRNK